MKTIAFEVPALYGDHHVIEIRRILGAIPGVEDIYASSAFRQVEVAYDPEKVEAQKIEQALDEAGYLGEWALPEEADFATHNEEDRSKSYFRHTEVFETTRQVVTFSQKVSFTGRPLWNCPGMGVIKSEMED